MNKLVSPAYELGSIIRSLRKDLGMTGARLGACVGLSQSKISKLEQGHPPHPTPETVTALLDVLKAPKRTRREAQLLLLRLGSSGPTHPNYHFTYLQGRYLELERTSSLIQTVTYNVIPALLQTAIYREASLEGVGLDGPGIKLALRESFQRQDSIWNRSVAYEFLIHEAALYSMPATRQAQLAQLDKLERLIGLPNLEVGIIPTKAGLPILEPCNFVMYDKQIVIRSIGTVDLESQDSDTTLQYVQLYEQLSLNARFGSDAVQLISAASGHIAQLKQLACSPSASWTKRT